MTRYGVLWRFVFEADDIDTAEAAAGETARLMEIDGLPPVAAYKEANWWITDIVLQAHDESLALLLGRQLAKCGRLANEWLVSAISDLDDGGSCHAIFNADARNVPTVGGLRWALLELWQWDDSAP